MLLLVLILVLIAFGLLVVALMTGTVLWAWVSVAVSVAAALVLLVDYLQRRSAVKAGAASASAVRRQLPPPEPYVEYEPATEVLPVVPPPAVPVPGASDDTGGSSQPESESAKTIVIPTVQPSGSSSRPSGAEDQVTSSSGVSSQSVTESGSDRSSAEPAEGDDVAPSEPTKAVPSGGESTVLVKASGENGDEPEEPGGDAESTALVDARDLDEGQDDEEQPSEKPAEEGAKAEEAPATKATAAASPPPPPDSSAAPGTTEQPTLFAEASPTSQQPAAQEEQQAEEPEQAASTEEPPVESRDAAVAAFVAGLDDEVVVVDEQPRYHVTGCRALVPYQVIPLPAREAVELGFTPCGWCSPDLTLSTRHNATAPR